MGLNFWLLFFLGLVVICVIMAVISVWWEKRSEHKKYSLPDESKNEKTGSEDGEIGPSA